MIKKIGMLLILVASFFFTSCDEGGQFVTEYKTYKIEVREIEPTRRGNFYSIYYYDEFGDMQKEPLYDKDFYALKDSDSITILRKTWVPDEK